MRRWGDRTASGSATRRAASQRPIETLNRNSTKARASAAIASSSFSPTLSLTSRSADMPSATTSAKTVLPASAKARSAASAKKRPTLVSGRAGPGASRPSPPKPASVTVSAKRLSAATRAVSRHLLDRTVRTSWVSVAARAEADRVNGEDAMNSTERGEACPAASLADTASAHLLPMSLRRGKRSARSGRRSGGARRYCVR